MLQNIVQTQHRLPSFWLGVNEEYEEVVAGDGGEAEEEEVDYGEDVRGGEGAPVAGEVCPQLHLGYWASSLWFYSFKLIGSSLIYFILEASQNLD